MNRIVTRGFGYENRIIARGFGGPLVPLIPEVICNKGFVTIIDPIGGFAVDIQGTLGYVTASNNGGLIIAIDKPNGQVVVKIGAKGLMEECT